MRKIWLGTMALCLCLGYAQTGHSATISFNKATAEEIVSASEGLVEADLAKAIVDYREKNGPFKTPEELRSVPGMPSVIYNSLDPELANGDVVYSSDVKTGMKAY